MRLSRSPASGQVPTFVGIKRSPTFRRSLATFFFDGLAPRYQWPSFRKRCSPNLLTEKVEMFPSCLPDAAIRFVQSECHPRHYLPHPISPFDPCSRLKITCGVPQHFWPPVLLRFPFSSRPSTGGPSARSCLACRSFLRPTSQLLQPL